MNKTDIKNQFYFCTEQYMLSELGMNERKVNSILNKLLNYKEIIEFSHTPQIGHLGIYRLILQTLLLAKKNEAFPIFILNDHLPANYLPESRYIPISINGKKIAHPPTFQIAKKQQSFSMSKTLPPSCEVIENIHLRLLELFPNKKKKVCQLTEIMQETAAEVKSHAFWLTRIFLELGRVDIPVISTEKLISCSHDELIHELQQRALGWAICKNCGLNNGRWQSTHQTLCKHCASNDCTFFPDVIGRQVIANSIFSGLRVCGTKKSYQAKADIMSLEKFKNRPLKRFHVTGTTEFRTPDGLYISRPSMVQYFIESKPNITALESINPMEYFCFN